VIRINDLGHMAVRICALTPARHRGRRHRLQLELAAGADSAVNGRRRRQPSGPRPTAAVRARRRPRRGRLSVGHRVRFGAVGGDVTIVGSPWARCRSTSSRFVRASVQPRTEGRCWAPEVSRSRAEATRPWAVQPLRRCARVPATAKGVDMRRRRP
jgi:hypothetical protein